MSRILAIDYGMKRVGLAVTDPLQLIAGALTTVPANEILKFLSDYCKKEAVELFVVGMPRRMNNELSQVAGEIEKFIEKLKKQIPQIPVVTADERFTSKIAFQTMIDVGLKKMERRNKETIDKISATIILQSYLESRNISQSRI